MMHVNQHTRATNKTLLTFADDLAGGYARLYYILAPVLLLLRLLLLLLLLLLPPLLRRLR